MGVRIESYHRNLSLEGSLNCLQQIVTLGSQLVDVETRPLQKTITDVIALT